MVNDHLKQEIYFMSFRLATFLSVAILLLILVYVFKEGVGVIDMKFLTSMWSHRDITSGGIFPAIMGTVFLALGVSIISIPTGICTAIYLNEYAKDTLLTRIIKLAVRNLAGVPSVVYGLFGLSLFVVFLKLGTSLFAASLTLGCMTLPWIITTSEEALKAVPVSFREGSYALGATKWQTIKAVVLPHSLGGILTGSILGISRAMGETAPIIMVGATFFMGYLPNSPFDKFMALPYHLFILATQHSSPHAREYALGTALVLITLVFILNSGVFAIRYTLRRKKEW
ncbi:MAG: phosphate ABC transporter permease PstA [Candidatus Altiarchaeales archaeon]|nr:phosphate ABC transporter permease PstA [Candidatus Altiarchaeota archaeon]MBU4342293.1 phosphate ABC transporter permease PstA [Candidatus Altiarchaeota archaeon]MBU4432768.1 phosphate ABC transporter permease PstA [Patescibacteria group bacterium]MBU4437470.1 phosphate ABC transporter permease PstA [Candidatus Altiarchaeota archaeon]MCG2782044.1 phosphate ABC transporter permease PstA [Candidatus Altiarchaeales archaeon]